MRTFPTDWQYQQAIQHPERCFLDPQLKYSTVAQNGMGLPVPWSGSFACTYQLTDQHKHIWAVRCFRKDLSDRQRRYERVSNYVNNHASRFLRRIDYLENEMLVEGTRYPITKMPWVNGDTLGDFLDVNHYAQSTLSALSIEFRDLVSYLQKYKIAHGDLSHDNILIQNTGMVLVDYDGLYVPGLENLASAELGHANFQHPQRKYTDFGDHLDRFSSIVIYLALQALMEMPELWTRYGPKATSGSQAEGILFQKQDFLKPKESPLLNDLETISNLRNSIKAFRKICQGSLGEVPQLSEFISDKPCKLTTVFVGKQVDRAEYDAEIGLESFVMPSALNQSAERSLYELTSIPASPSAPDRQRKSSNKTNWSKAIPVFMILLIGLIVFGWASLNFTKRKITQTSITVPTTQEDLVSPVSSNLSNTNRNGRSIVIAEVSKDIAKLNVRPGPGMNYPPVTQVAGGVKLEIYSRSGTWLKVKSTDGTISGWVSEIYVQILSGSLETVHEINSGQTKAPTASTLLGSQIPTRTSSLTTNARSLATSTPAPVQLTTATIIPLPTSLPTAPSHPTVMLSPTPVLLGANCASNPDAIFAALWQQHRTMIGCPSTKKMTIPTIAEEIFQGGHMFWRNDLDEIYIIYDRVKNGDNLFEGAWQTDPAWKWDNSNPDGIGLHPPPELYEPKRGFGWLWRTHLGSENGRLGWALDREYGFNQVGQVQYFESGFIFKGSDPKTYLLLNDGRFWAR